MTTAATSKYRSWLKPVNRATTDHPFTDVKPALA